MQKLEFSRFSEHFMRELNSEHVFKYSFNFRKWLRVL
jgi:hypothetical protein